MKNEIPPEIRARMDAARAAAEEAIKKRHAEVAQQLRTSSPNDDPKAIAKARGAAEDQLVATLEAAEQASQIEAARMKFAALNAKLSPEQRLSNLMNALADDVEEMTDEQLLAEAAETGVDIKGLAVKLRRMVTEGGKRSLLSAEAATAKAKEVRVERRARLIAAIRLFTTEKRDELGFRLPNGSTRQLASEVLAHHPYIVRAPDDVAELVTQAYRQEGRDCQELREAAEAYFGGDFREADHE